jgi:hypothetical protein
MGFDTNDNEGNDSDLSTDIDNSDLFSRVILNDLIFQKLEEFLNYRNGDMNSLLNVSRRFKILKKMKYYWKLNKKYSAEYYRDDTFKSKMDSLLIDSKIQLSLNFSKFTETWSLIQPPAEYDVIDVSTLSNIHELDLTGCDRIVDISALGNVHKLTLIFCSQIVEVSTLGSVHELSLFHCKGVTDASALGRVYKFNLGGTCITHADGLGDVYDLDLSECDYLSDVNGLGSNHILDLSSCHCFHDVDALGRVHELNLSRNDTMTPSLM